MQALGRRLPVVAHGSSDGGSGGRGIITVTVEVATRDADTVGWEVVGQVQVVVLRGPVAGGEEVRVGRVTGHAV